MQSLGLGRADPLILCQNEFASEQVFIENRWPNIHFETKKLAVRKRPHFTPLNGQLTFCQDIASRDPYFD